MNSRDQIEEIKSKIAIEDLVGSYTQLKKSGKNFKGLCPFHNEKTPSFFVSPEKGMCWCFGCHKGGDIFKFLQEIENIEFGEALNILSEKAGVEIQKYSGEKKSEKDRLREAVSKAQEFFVTELEKSQKAKKYLEEREISQETQEKFSIGFAPNSRTKLIDFLLSKSFNRNEISKAGLGIFKDIKSGKIEDRFFGRIMIPLKDTLGRTVGFTGRVLDKNINPKYLNTSETPIFRKKEIIFGINFAKNKAKELGEILLMEGNMDVISAFNHGIENAIASSGTAFSEHQGKIISRTVPKIKIVFDSDEAGKNATKLAINESVKAGLDVDVVKISNGKDPDEAIKKDKDNFLKDIKESLPAFDYLLEDFKQDSDPNSARGKARIAKKMSEFLNSVENEIEKEFYIRKLSEELGISAEAIVKELNKSFSVKTKREEEKEFDENKITEMDHLLGLLIAFKDDFNLEEFSETENLCKTQMQKNLYKNIEKMYNFKDIFESSAVPENELEKLKFLEILAESKYGEFKKDVKVKAARTIYQRLLRGRSEGFDENFQAFKKKFLKKDGQS